MSVDTVKETKSVGLKDVVEERGLGLRAEVERAVEEAVHSDFSTTPSFAAYDCQDFQVGHKIFINEVSLKVDALPQLSNPQGSPDQGSKDPGFENKGFNKKKLLVSGVLFVIISVVVCISVFVKFSPSKPIETSRTHILAPEKFLIERDDWKAMSSKKPLKDLTTPVSYVVIAHTAGPFCETVSKCSAIVRRIQSFHLNKFDDIFYNFLVGGDGHIYEGRGWDKRMPDGTPLFNQSIYISFMGNFMLQEPTDVQLATAQKFLLGAVDEGHLTQNYTVLLHSQVKETLSPGTQLSKVVKKWSRWGTFTVI